MDVVRKEEEIDKLVSVCHDGIDKEGSKFPGMSYEQGIVAAIEWLRGDMNEHPMDLE